MSGCSWNATDLILWDWTRIEKDLQRFDRACVRTHCTYSIQMGWHLFERFSRWCHEWDLLPQEAGTRNQSESWRNSFGLISWTLSYSSTTGMATQSVRVGSNEESNNSEYRCRNSILRRRSCYVSRNLQSLPQRNFHRRSFSETFGLHIFNPDVWMRWKKQMCLFV